jgi:hypothetical protein
MSVAQDITQVNTEIDGTEQPGTNTPPLLTALDAARQLLLGMHDTNEQPGNFDFYVVLLAIAEELHTLNGRS